MDTIDLWLINSTIEAKTGSKSWRYDPKKDHNLFLDFVIQTEPTTAVPKKHNFNVFFAEDGVPDLFTLMGFADPVVCYHLGYVGKFIKFRNYIMVDPDTPMIDQEGIANLFELVSALYLQNGNGAFATNCLLQSIIQTTSRTIDKDVYKASINSLHISFFNEGNALEEAPFTLLYFGFAHEIGHTYADDCLGSNLKIHVLPTTDKAITEAVITSAKSAFKDYPDADHLFTLWHKDYITACKDKASVLHCDNLRAEILADNVGFNILITSLGGLAKYRNQPNNLKIIISETIIGLFLVQLFEACKYLVKALPAEQQKPALISRYFPNTIEDLLGREGEKPEHSALYARLNGEQMIQDFQIAHQVRWEYLKPSLQPLLMMHLYPGTWAVKGGRLVATCSPQELEKRQDIAAANLERYLASYTGEMLKLQARLGDVLHFAGHMVTGKVPEYRTKRHADETFAEHIAGNFQTYLKSLTGKQGTQRKQEIFTQLKEYKNLLQRCGTQTDLEKIESILQQLQSPSKQPS